MADKDKNKKAKFQEGDYSDIKIKGILNPKKLEVKPVDMPTRKETGKFKSVEMPTKKETGKFKSVEMPKFKKKETITVPSDSKHIKKFKGGGIATRGLGRAFMKGGKA